MWSGNGDVHWNIKKCVLDTMSDWVGKVDRKAREPYTTEEIISKVDERRKWKNVNNEERRNTYQKTEEQTEIKLRMWQNREISKNSTLRFNVYEDQGTRLKKKHGTQDTGIEYSQAYVTVIRDEYWQFGRTILQSSAIIPIDQKTQTSNLSTR